VKLSHSFVLPDGINHISWVEFASGENELLILILC